MPPDILNDPITFDALRKQGIKEIEQLSGKVWTDYNLHDPGITILEHLCYGLTDLAYRVDHDVADILTAEDESISYKGLGLELPDRIFPCRPVTLTDYQKLILDAVPGIDAVWIESEKKRSGRYRIRVKPSAGNAGTLPDGDRIINAVRQVYHAHRNLCEDLVDVKVIGTEPIDMEGEVDIVRGVNPETVLARIYFEAARLISPWPVFKSFKELYEAGIPLDQILEGPLLTHGVLNDEDLLPQDRTITRGEISAGLLDIEGVKQIKQLKFKGIPENPEPCFDIRNILNPPKGSGDIHIRLRQEKIECKINFFEFKHELDQLFNLHHQVRTRHQHIRNHVSPPKGRYRDIGRYHSIQNHFPDIYGINAFGVPESESARRKSEARNLKAYLLFFEQTLADFLSTFHHIPDLAGLNTRTDPLSWYRALNEKAVPNGKHLYRSAQDETADEILSKAIGAQVDFNDIKNSVFDYLLAVYGEALAQPWVTDKKQQIRNKAGVLKQIADISQNRGGAVNLLAPMAPGNISGLEKKVRLVAGIGPEVRYHVAEHILLMPSGREALKKVPHDFFDNRISIVFSGEDFENSHGVDRFKQAVDLNCPAHLFCTFYLVSHEKMARFKDKYSQWLAKKQEMTHQDSELDALSVELIRFFLSLELGEEKVSR